MRATERATLVALVVAITAVAASMLRRGAWHAPGQAARTLDRHATAQHTGRSKHGAVLPPWSSLCSIPLAVALAVGAWLASAYVTPYLSPMLGAYVAQPLLWIAPATVAIVALGIARREWLAVSGYLLPAICIGLTYVGILVIAGLAFGFGTSPYNHSPRGLALIIWYTAAILVSREVIRWGLFRSLRARNEELAFIVTWLLLFVTDIAPRAFVFNISDPSRSFEYVGRVILPAAASGLVATYLLARGGPLPAIAYSAVMSLFLVLSPILPDVPWTITAFVGVAVPVLALLVLQSLEEPDTTAEEVELIGPSPRLLVLAFCVVAMFWINTGILGFQPLIVHGVSMQPEFHTGDLVVTQRVPAGDLQVGDIIQFRRGTHDVFHRIIEVRDGDGERVFITQGDNMPAADSPVPAAHVRGKLLWHVPKAGLPMAHAREFIGGLRN